MDTLNNLFCDEMADMYDAECLIVGELPKTTKAAGRPEPLPPADAENPHSKTARNSNDGKHESINPNNQ